MNENSKEMKGMELRWLKNRLEWNWRMITPLGDGVPR